MNQKLVFLDIDGTLTSPGKNVPPESAMRAVRAAQSNGHRIFLCTGRNLDMLQPVLKLGFEGAVASTGGYVFAGKDVLFDCPMTQTELNTAMRLFEENDVIRTIEACEGTWMDDKLDEFVAQAGEGGSELKRWRTALAEQLNIRPMREYGGQPVYKIVFMCRNEKQIEPARQALGDRFRFLVHELTEYNCVDGELINRKFDKGRGVRIIADHFGILLQDTIGFGDSMNDLEMLETTGCSVCMANGSAQLREKSSLICPSVEEDGIEWAFRTLGLI
ncbi:MAG: HAD family phosphatase [Clostridia bacterium]|nr:HAD family phosphatase [Clostridia bacterium]